MAPNDRAIVLIDGGYFEKVRLAFGQDIDLIRFSEQVSAPLKWHRSYYYDCPPWLGNEPTKQDKVRMQKKQHYFDGLQHLDRFEVRKGRTQRVELSCPNCKSKMVNFKQKGVDVLLSVDMVNFAWSKQADTIVLVAGDSDFVPAVAAAKASGTIIKLVYAKPPISYFHHDIVKVCDEKLEFDAALAAQCPREKPGETR